MNLQIKLPDSLKQDLSKVATYSAIANLFVIYFKILSLSVIRPEIVFCLSFVAISSIVRIFSKKLVNQKYFALIILIVTWMSGIGWCSLFVLEYLRWNTLINFEVITSLLILMGISAGAGASLGFWPFLAFGFIAMCTLTPMVLLIQDPHGRYIGLISLAYMGYLMANVKRNNEILEQKTNEQKSNAHKHQLLQTLVDSIPGYVSLLDKDLKYKVISKKLSEKLNISQNEMIGRKIGYQGFKSDLIKFIEEFHQNQEVVASEKFLLPLYPGGEGRWHLVILTRSPQGDIVCVSLDINDQVQKDQEVNMQRAVLVHSNQLAQLGEMMGTVAHEINAPLGVTKISLGILKDSIKDSTSSKENLINQVEKLEKTNSRIEKIIHGLKNKVRESQQDPFVPVALKSLFEDTREMVQYKLQDLNIPLEIEFNENQKIMGREVQLGQVLTNLVKNSIEAIGTSKNPWIKITTEKSDDFFKIKVTDSGPGIPPEIRKKLMQPFFTTKPVGIGTGLGLAICQKIMKEHGGDLAVDEMCPNTCFVMSIPLKSTKM